MPDTAASDGSVHYPAPAWHVGGGRVLQPTGRPLVMGILNLTPDSFHPDSRVTGPAQVTAAGLAMPEVVRVGRPSRDTYRQRAARVGRELGSDAVGEVCINGPGVFAGYYRDPQATAESLNEDWYHTGDLGFLHRGEL